LWSRTRTLAAVSASLAMTRHRRVVLAVALAAAAGYPVRRWFAPPGDRALDDLLFVGLLAALVISLVLLIVTSLAERPAVFIVQPEEPSFNTPPSFPEVATALLLTLAASRQVGSLVVSIKSHDPLLDNAVLAVIWIAGSFLLVVGAWRGMGVHLRPEGLRWRQPTGSISVPWEALAPGYPLRPAIRAGTLALTYARPELVRRRGLVLSQRLLRIDTVHAWFIADAIRHYVTHPECRAAMGTEAEYRRLLHTMRNGMADPPARSQPPMSQPPPPPHEPTS
jgi:hypothetical protein